MTLENDHSFFMESNFRFLALENNFMTSKDNLCLFSVIEVIKLIIIMPYAVAMLQITLRGKSINREIVDKSQDTDSLQ